MSKLSVIESRIPRLRLEKPILDFGQLFWVGSVGVFNFEYFQAAFLDSLHRQLSALRVNIGE